MQCLSSELEYRQLRTVWKKKKKRSRQSHSATVDKCFSIYQLVETTKTCTSISTFGVKLTVNIWRCVMPGVWAWYEELYERVNVTYGGIDVWRYGGILSTREGKIRALCYGNDAYRVCAKWPGWMEWGMRRWATELVWENWQGMERNRRFEVISTRGVRVSVKSGWHYNLVMVG